LAGESTEKNLVAPCGLYCGWCPFYVVGSKEFTCKGCWSREKCEIRDCAKNKGLELCTFCEAFPCLKLYGVYGQMNKFFDDIKTAFPQGVKKK
jgi:hypothetical protein